MHTTLSCFPEEGCVNICDEFFRKSFNSKSSTLHRNWKFVTLFIFFEPLAFNRTFIYNLDTFFDMGKAQ